MSRYRTRSWRAFDPALPAVARSAPFVPAAQVRILGLDPGSRRTGFGVIECSSTALTVLAYGCLNVERATPAARLRRIFAGLAALIDQHAPQEVAIERVFVSRNVDSALKLGQARGAALCAVPEGLPVFEYAPRAIKQALVGSGAAEKRQVAHMVRVLLALHELPVADAADALAAAVCHAHARRLAQLTHGAAVVARGTPR